MELFGDKKIFYYISSLKTTSTPFKMKKKSLLLLSLLASFSVQQNILHAGESEGELTTINESNKKGVFKYVSPEFILFETVAFLAATIQYAMDKFCFEKYIGKTNQSALKEFYGELKYKLALTLVCLLLGFGVAMVARKLLYCEESNKHTLIRGVILTIVVGLAMLITAKMGPLAVINGDNFDPDDSSSFYQKFISKWVYQVGFLETMFNKQIISGLLLIILGFTSSKISRFVLPSKFDIEKTADVVSSLSKDNLV